jgi:hypothetical protein
MTLTAISKELVLFSPAVALDQGTSRSEVAMAMRQLQANGLFCPHCHRKTGELAPVRFRNATDRKPHFFHLQALEGGTECPSFSGESEKHLAAKSAIAERLKAVQGLLNMEIDTRYLSSPGLVWRKPDILVTYQNGAIESHEIQVSPITSSEILERTADQKKHGAAQVIWYLYGKNYNPENRTACAKHGITCYHLWFLDRDDSRPRWKLDEGIREKPDRSPSTSTRDECNSRQEVVTPSNPAPRFQPAPVKPELIAIDPQWLQVGDLVNWTECPSYLFQFAQGRVTAVSADRASLRMGFIHHSIAIASCKWVTEIDASKLWRQYPQEVA